MKLHAIAAALTLALGTLGMTTVALASKVIDVEIGEAPPSVPGRIEFGTPDPREGYVYEPGHYVYNGHHYVWKDGEYIPKREGHHWVPYVLQRDGDHWHFRSGHWDDDEG
jgi:hypothetical protein